MFLPEEYDGIPAGPSKYMKLEEGQNVFRVLSSAIVGYEYWTEDKGKRTPHRVKTFDEVPEPVKNAKDSREKAKHFWAFTVYNRNEEVVQILELTQRRVMAGIKALVDDIVWGDPKAYDLTIVKKKTGPNPTDVEYTVTPRPHKVLEEQIKDDYNAMKIDLTALYRNGDPFEDGDSEAINEAEMADIEKELSK